MLPMLHNKQPAPVTIWCPSHYWWRGVSTCDYPWWPQTDTNDVLGPILPMLHNKQPAPATIWCPSHYSWWPQTDTNDVMGPMLPMLLNKQRAPANIYSPSHYSWWPQTDTSWCQVSPSPTIFLWLTPIMSPDWHWLTTPDDPRHWQLMPIINIKL